MINVYVLNTKQLSFLDGCSQSKNVKVNSIHVYDPSKDKRKKCTSFLNIEDRFVYESLLRAPGNEYTLVCCDRMVSHCSATTIYDCLEQVIMNCNFDIFYLASWAERCDLFCDVHEIENYKIVKSMSPHGTSCLLFSPYGREKFLSQISCSPEKSLDFTLHSKISCFNTYTTLPSLVNFDITLRKTDLEYVKLCKCREVPESVRPVEVTRRNTTTLNLFWFILVVIIIICIATILISITDASKLPVVDSKNYSIPYNPSFAPYPPFNPVGTLESYPS